MDVANLPESLPAMGLETLVSLLAPGTAVTAVIVVVMLFLRHVRASDADRKADNVRCEETIRGIVKDHAEAMAGLAEAQRDGASEITLRLDRMIERLPPR